MTQTDYYNLKKPAASDYYNVSDFNDNADRIDAALHGLEEGKAGLGEDGLILPEQLPEMSTLLRAWPVLTTAGWAGSTGAWSQTVAVAGIKATDVTHVYPACSTTDAELAGRQRAAYNPLEPYVDSAEGTLTAYCKQSAAPTVDVPILVEVMR